jgi:hypothetical protein
MSQANVASERTGVAGEDMSAKQYYIVQLDASGNIEVGEGATDLLVGVLQNKPEAGEAALYRHGGTTKVIAGGNVSIGDLVTSDASGKAVATTTNKDIVIGRALASAVSGDIFEVQMGIHKASF